MNSATPLERLPLNSVALLICLAIIGCGGPAADPAKPNGNVPPKPMAPVNAADDMWPMFMHDQYHHGVSTADFPSADLKEAWAYSLGTHVWTYEKGACVWSSPIVGRVGDKTLVFVGAYDRSLYAVDASTGKQAWRFPTGAPVYSSPALWMEHDPPLLIAAATDRTIYGLDARNREKLWAFECMEWVHDVQCRMSAVTLADIDGEKVALVGAWTSNPAGIGGKQIGEVVALSAATGELKWRVKITSGVVRTPAVATVDGVEIVYVTADDGVLHALSATNGERLWRKTADEFLRSSPTFGVVEGQPLIFHGTRFHNILAINARTGRREWNFKAHFWVDSTPAFAPVNEKPTLFFGSYDRNVFAVDAVTHKSIWNTGTGGDVCSSPAIASIAGRPAAFIHSLDNKLYAFDAASGDVKWSRDMGKLIWSHVDRGDTIWSSPCIAVVDGVPTLFFASHDGTLRAFTSAGGDVK